MSPSPLSPSGNKNTAQCSSMTKAGKQCSRQVKLPSTHSHVDPIPVVYCRRRRDAMYTAQTGFYARQKGKEDRFVEFRDYIPPNLQRDTQLALRVEMERAASLADVPGYIYTYEIRGSSLQTSKLLFKFMSSSSTFMSVLDPKYLSVIQLKVGRTVNLMNRLDQWDKQCGSKMQIV
ncbi:hypothetical protein K503DRAFT_798890 [Rhizopogon vinicolor AM-OR11-026]|uniref:Uncharacterized protein n=1 Tax=Rhizopogon vinicolor AM-OR11-026 TaxID=1314800 RepID=A0A1B7N673_9AGAM|nr:hypothetical protein K503DRAFT_798890 [Rhizopogon vinicolor AM-OR11-026]